jgi:hypothetical protein
MKHVTREETPPNVASFIRQRTRWQQGFIQVLFKGTWLKLSSFDQRLLALYTLSYPFQQAFITLLWIPAVLSVFWLRLPASIALLSFLPLYSLLFQFLTTVVGAYVFTREYHLKFPLHLPLSMAITFLPFHWLLGISAIRAAYRELLRQHDWEKTAHVGAHRQQSEIATSIRKALPLISTANLDNILNKSEESLKNLALEETRELVAVAHEQAMHLPSNASSTQKEPLDIAFEHTAPLNIHLARQIEVLQIIHNESLYTTHPIDIQETAKLPAVSDPKTKKGQPIEEQETSQLLILQNGDAPDSITEQATREYPALQEQEQPPSDQRSQQQNTDNGHQPAAGNSASFPAEKRGSELDEDTKLLPASKKKHTKKPAAVRAVITSPVSHIKGPEPEFPVSITTTMTRKRERKTDREKDQSGVE